MIRPGNARPGATISNLLVVISALVAAACSYREPPPHLQSLLPDMHVAALNGDLQGVEAALVMGGDVNGTDLFGNPPLVYAAINGQARAAELLIAYGGDVNGARGNPLRFSVKNGHEAVVELLLAKGAHLHPRDPDGCTPLHLAALRNRTSIARLLIGKGADVNARMETGDTPLHIAALNNNLRLSGMLLDHQADVHAVNSKGKTPLARAEEIQETYRKQAARRIPVPPESTDYSSVIELLRNHGGGTPKGS